MFGFTIVFDSRDKEFVMANEVQVNALGDACPIPVVKTIKALASLGGAGTVETLVDNKVAVENLKRLEAKIVEGPYIHHCVAIHANVVPVLYEACKYIGIAPDLYDPIEEDVKAYLRGE